MSGDNIVPLLAIGVATGGIGFAAGGASAASAGAGAAASAAGGSASSGLFTAQNIALASAGISAVGSIGQGLAAQSAADARAAEFEMRRQSEATAKATEDLARERRLRSVQSAQRAQFAAGGISGGSGTPLAMTSQAASTAGREARLAGIASSTRQSIFGINTRSARRSGIISLVGGLTNAAGTVGTQIAREKRRGG